MVCMRTPSEEEAYANEVFAALAQLDGSRASVLRLLTGMTQAELDELGGVSE